MDPIAIETGAPLRIRDQQIFWGKLPLERASQRSVKAIFAKDNDIFFVTIQSAWENPISLIFTRL
jgi:hypothetical protein